MKELLEEYGAAIIVCIIGVGLIVFGGQMLDFISASL